MVGLTPQYFMFNCTTEKEVYVYSVGAINYSPLFGPPILYVNVYTYCITAPYVYLYNMPKVDFRKRDKL